MSWLWTTFPDFCFNYTSEKQNSFSFCIPHLAGSVSSSERAWGSLQYSKLWKRKMMEGRDPFSIASKTIICVFKSWALNSFTRWTSSYSLHLWVKWRVYKGWGSPLLLTLMYWRSIKGTQVDGDRLLQDWYLSVNGQGDYEWTRRLWCLVWS